MSFPQQPGGNPPNNPYATPQGGGHPQMGMGGPMHGSREAAVNKVKLPAIFLIVLSPISILFFIFDLGMRIFNLANDNLILPANANKDAVIAGAIGGGVLDVVAMISAVVIMLGALKMLKLESYSFARTACILSCIPCMTACCILGIPFGIWGLVTLNDPAVKQHFS